MLCLSSAPAWPSLLQLLPALPQFGLGAIPIVFRRPTLVTAGFPIRVGEARNLIMVEMAITTGR